MAKKAVAKEPVAAPRLKSSVLLDTRVVYCGDNLEQLAKLPDACVDLIYIDPPFNSNRNYEVFWGETKEKRAFEDRHENTKAYHCHPVERGNKRLNDLKTMRILCFGDVSDMNFVCDFSAAATVPNCRNARRKNDFCSSHRVDSSRTISPLRPTLPRQPLDS